MQISFKTSKAVILFCKAKVSKDNLVLFVPKLTTIEPILLLLLSFGINSPTSASSIFN